MQQSLSYSLLVWLGSKKHWIQYVDSLHIVPERSHDLSAVATCSLEREQKTVVEFNMKDVFWKHQVTK